MKNQKDIKHCRICGKPVAKWKSKYCLFCGDKHKQLDRESVLRLLGDKCSSCGITDKRVLQIDHVNGNGCQERKLGSKWFGGSSHQYYLHILEVEGKGYQILCANCNWIKRYERKEYRKRI